MLEKQKQDIGDNSTAIQVNGNLTITPYQEIKAIFLDLFELNFPKIQQIASDKAEASVKELLEELDKRFTKNKDTIDTEKFSDPAIQFEMQAIAVDVGRRGNKSNIELLAELLTTILSKDCPEIIELIAVEARKILPMLSKEHLSYLSLEVLATEAHISEATGDLLNKNLSDILVHIDKVNSLTYSDLQYISGMGCIAKKGVRVVNSTPSLIKNINEYEKLNLEQTYSKAKELNHPNVINFLDLMTKISFGTYDLGATGKLIGWMNLGKYTEIDIKELFK